MNDVGARSSSSTSWLVGSVCCQRATPSPAGAWLLSMSILIVAAVLALVSGATSVAAATTVDVPHRVATSGSVCVDAVGDPGDLAVVNVTPVRAASRGFGAMTSSGDDAAGVSDVNFAAGTIDPNVTMVAIGADGRICYRNSAHASVHVIVDQLATISADAVANTTRRRLVDTRDGDPVAANGQRCFAANGDPFDLAVVNVTPVQAHGRGYGRVDSSDQRASGISNVNFDVDSIDPNLAVAPIGTDGQLCFITSETVHVIVDQVAVISDTAIATRSQERLLDTRETTPVPPSGTRCFDVVGSPGDLAVVNVTPVRAAGRGFGYVSPTAQQSSNISNVNFDVGTTDPNIATVEVSDSQACFRNSADATVDVVVDSLVTLSSTAVVDTTSRRLIDTRVGSPVTFDMTAAFGSVGTDAVAVDADGTVLAAAGDEVLIRHWDGTLTPIALPAGIDVSQAWVGPDNIAVLWGTTNGAEIDLGRAAVVSTLSSNNGTWTRTLTEQDRYTVNPSRPSGPLNLGLLTLPGTTLPTVEGAGCFETIYDENQSWMISRPANCAASVNEIVPVPAGGYVATLTPPDTQTQAVYTYHLAPSGAAVSLAVVELTSTTIDVQPGADGITTLHIANGTATIGFTPIP